MFHWLLPPCPLPPDLFLGLPRDLLHVLTCSHILSAVRFLFSHGLFRRSMPEKPLEDPSAPQLPVPSMTVLTSVQVLLSAPPLHPVSPKLCRPRSCDSLRRPQSSVCLKHHSLSTEANRMLFLPTFSHSSIRILLFISPPTLKTGCCSFNL